MSATDAHFTGLLEELTARSLAEQVRTAQRYRDLLQQVAAGDLDVTALRTEHDRLVADHQAQLMRDITELGVRYYQSILDLNRSYVDRLFDQLYAAAGTGRAQAQGPPAAAQPAAVELRLAGRPGDRVEAGFAVENSRDVPADIVFYASEFAGDDGTVFRVPLELDPPRILLAANGEHPFLLGLTLDPEHFRPAGRYRAQVLVRGGEDLELHLTVEVEPDPDPEPLEAEPVPDAEPPPED
jgi:hypothetical protein